MFKNYEPRNVNRYEAVRLAAGRARELNEGVNIPEGQETRKVTMIAMSELESGQLEKEDKEA